MGFKTGIIVGAALGYYYGTKAGRERYDEIEEVLTPFRDQLTEVGLAEAMVGLANALVEEARATFSRYRDTREASPTGVGDAASPASWIRSGGSAHV